MKRVSIVIPCYNEEDGIHHLAAELKPVLEEVQKKYEIEVILVDDGSKDQTFARLQEFFTEDYAKIVQHEKNMNLGAALRTGISHTTGDYVVMIDSDCSFHPRVILKLLENVNEDTDIVSATGLHPEGGQHVGTGKHRLFLSKAVAGMYQLLLGKKVYSPTSMNRVYKRKVLDNVSFKENGFMAVTELLVKSLLKGYSFKEIPFTNKKRQFGVSKMKFSKTAKEHLVLMSRILRYRLQKNEW